MARPIKKGLEYFPFDVGFFSDKKVKILKSRYGADGIVIYQYLLCDAGRPHGDLYARRSRSGKRLLSNC